MHRLILPLLTLLILVSLHLCAIPSNHTHLSTSVKLSAVVALKKDVYAHTTYASLTIEQMAGQHLFISLADDSSEQDLRSLLSEVHPGGILLFASNIKSADQTRTLITSLQTIAREIGDPPLFIAVDEEGGVVERIWFDPTTFSAAELGNLNNEQSTKDTVRETARILTSLGFNVNFAPVADIAFSNNSVMLYRSYGSSPESVARQVSWTVEEYLENDIRPTVKHFPGHGRTSTDSHSGLPLIEISKEEWLDTDAIPFKAAIDAGTTFVMSGHIQFSSVDSAPASSSKIWLTDILREELGFKGIVVSDDIKMGAYHQDYPTTALQMLIAGNDMIIAAVDTQALTEIADAIKTQSPENLSEGHERSSILRILRAKHTITNTDVD